MKTYRITVYPATMETYLVKAENEEDAWSELNKGNFEAESEDCDWEDWKDPEIEEVEEEE